MNAWIKRALIVAAAVLGYGGWAVYSNMLGQPATMDGVAWRAGCIQGSYAGLLTLVNISILEALFRFLLQRQGATAATLNTLLASTVAQYSIIIPVHLLNGTPNILLTLLPGLVIGTAFSSAYLWSLRRYARYALRDAKR
ncbi:MAG: hypothetical protein KJO24_00875 [Gammaproteobacteria bacterium]|nr:hypothetical protein [Gammaproteobacteria bacterium]